MREQIEKRIDDATPTQSKFNNWPTDMEVIRTTVYDLTNAEEAYTAGQLIGRETYGYRQIFPDRVPFDLPERHWMVSVKFMPGPAKGQIDDAATRNLLAVFEASRTAQYGQNAIVVAIELGCRHEYETRTRYSHYSEGVCKKCGHKYAVDSSG